MKITYIAALVFFYSSFLVSTEFEEVSLMNDYEDFEVHQDPPLISATILSTSYNLESKINKLYRQVYEGPTISKKEQVQAVDTLFKNISPSENSDVLIIPKNIIHAYMIASSINSYNIEEDFCKIPFNCGLLWVLLASDRHHPEIISGKLHKLSRKKNEYYQVWNAYLYRKKEMTSKKEIYDDFLKPIQEYEETNLGFKNIYDIRTKWKIQGCSLVSEYIIRIAKTECLSS